MLNLFHILRIASKNHYEKSEFNQVVNDNWLRRRFNSKTKPYVLKEIFPFYDEIINALDSFGYDYEVVLNYTVNLKYQSDVYSKYYNKGVYYIERSYDSSQVLEFVPKMCVTIHFDEVNLTNRNNLKYTIKNLFFRFDISLTGIISWYRGARFKRTHLEENSKYVHPHLTSTRNPCNFSTFCIGDAPQLNFGAQIFHEFVRKNNKEEIENSFLFFLNQVKSFVEYESLEGGPYISTEVILGNTARNNNSKFSIHELTAHAKMFLRAFYSNFCDGVIPKEDICYFDGYDYHIDKVKAESLFFNEEFLRSNHLSTNIKQLFIEYTYNGEKMDYNNYSENEVIIHPEHYFYFNNKKLVHTTSNDTQGIKPEQVKIDVNKTFKHYVITAAKFIAKEETNYFV